MDNYQRKYTKRKADRLNDAHIEGRHTPNGFPHYSTTTGLCLCLDYCCHRANGCNCKGCPCHAIRMDHSTIIDLMRKENAA